MTAAALAAALIQSPFDKTQRPTAIRPGAAEQQKYRNGFEIDDHLSVRSPLPLDDWTSEACCSFAS